MALRGSMTGPSASMLTEFRRKTRQRFEKAALVASAAMARDALTEIRSEMKASGLGNLGQALGQGSDLAKNKRVHYSTADTFSASGWLFIRSGSPRSRGALEVYLGDGVTEILPRNGPYMWFPTDDVYRLVGLPIPRTGGGRGKANFRLQPSYWRRAGLDRKIGPLVRVKSDGGNPLLIVRNVGVNEAGKPRSARSLRKNGMPRKGDVAREYIVAFIGIPRTSRMARVNIRQIAKKITNRGSEYISAALKS